MSDSYDPALIEYLWELTDTAYISYAITVLLPIYEFIVTIDQEVATVWLRSKRCSLAALLLVSTRWCLVAGAVLGLAPVTPEVCKPLAVSARCIQIAGFLQVAVFSALRASAIWGKNRLIFLVIFVLGLTPVATNLFTLFLSKYSSDPSSPCIVEDGLSERVILIAFVTVTLFTRISVIAADALVLTLTLIKTYRQVMNGRKAGVAMSLSMCLLRDGTLYFVVLLALNVVELITHRTTSGTFVSLFVIILPPILVSRFMLNLRRMSDTDDTQTQGRISSVSAPQFAARVVESTLDDFSGPLERDVSLRDEDDGEHLGVLNDPKSENGIFAAEFEGRAAAMGVESLESFIELR